MTSPDRPSNLHAVLLYALLATWAVYLGIENWVLSDGFHVLTLREVDDMALQSVLAENHRALLAGKWERLFTCFSYGYGVLFWVIHTMLTLPFAALQNTQGVIILSREISLAFVIASVLLNFRSFRRLTSRASLQIGMSLLTILYAEYAFASLRFQTHSQILFFSSLSFFFIVRSKLESDRDLLCAAVAAGAAAGTKLVGFFFAPMLVLPLLLHSGLSRKTLWRGTKIVTVFLLTTMLATFPALFLFPWAGNDIGRFASIFQFYMAQSSTNMGGPENTQALFLLINGFGKFYLSLPILAVCLASLIFLKERMQLRGDIILAAVMTVCLTASYLLLKCAQGPHAISNYAIAVSFLIPLPLCLLDRFPRAGWIVLAMCALELALNGAFKWKLASLYYQKAKSSGTIQLLETIEWMRQSLEKPKKEEAVLLDHRALLPWSQLQDGFRIDYFFDNLHVVYHPYKYIVLRQGTLHQHSREEIQKLTPPYKTQVEKSAQTLERLIKNRTFADRRYEQIPTPPELKEGVILFRLVNP